MLVDVKVPVLSESVSEASVARWHKKAGEFVRRDEPLVDIETDKVMLEVVAPNDGLLKDVRKTEGAKVDSNEVIGVIDAEAKPAAEPESKPATPAAESQAKTSASVAAAAMAPAARKIAAEHDIKPESISGSGRGGRITKADVLKQVAQGAAPAVAVPHGVGGRPEQRVPMTRLRARIAERLVEAQHTAAMLTTFNEINMKPVMDLRARYQDAFHKKHNIKLGFMGFFIRACVEALKKYPVVNASIDGNDIIYHGYYDVGVAVSTERGLVVPIIRDADTLSIAALEQAVADYATRARDGKLAIEDLTGGTFSITNGGVFGSLLSTPILNPPQSAILGMHKIEQRAVVEGDQIVARPMMYVALSYDHRLIDGREAVSFLVAVKEVLEDPARLLLQV